MSVKRSATSGGQSGVPRPASLWGSLTGAAESREPDGAAAGGSPAVPPSAPGGGVGAHSRHAAVASGGEHAESPRSPRSTGRAAAAEDGPAPRADVPAGASARTSRARPETGTSTGSGTSSRPAGAGAPGHPARVRPSGRTRKAHLRLTHVDPWSVMKTSFLLSIAFGIVCVVAVAIIWTVLGAAGVWDSINTMVQDTVGSDSSTPFDVTDYVGTSRVVGFTMIAAVIDVVLITAVATLGAFVYNLAATLLGGVEVTLTEDR